MPSFVKLKNNRFKTISFAPLLTAQRAVGGHRDENEDDGYQHRDDGGKHDRGFYLLPPRLAFRTATSRATAC